MRHRIANLLRCLAARIDDRPVVAWTIFDEVHAHSGANGTAHTEWRRVR